MTDIEKLLNTKTKQELVAMISQWVTDNELNGEVVMGEFAKHTTTDVEQSIIDKLNNNITLTAEDKQLITDTLHAKGKTNVSYALKNKNEFLAFIVEYKILKYFDMIWKTYPRKVGKGEGKKAFLKLIGTKKVDEIDVACKYVMQKVTQYVTYCQDHNTEEQFILHFSTFCNSKKYL